MCSQKPCGMLFSIAIFYWANPDFVKNPMAKFLSKDYAAKLRTTIKSEGDTIQGPPARNGAA